MRPFQSSWPNLYESRNLFAPTSNNAEDLAFMVKYVRRELKALDDYDGEKLNAGIVQFGKPEASF